MLLLLLFYLAWKSEKITQIEKKQTDSNDSLLRI